MFLIYRKNKSRILNTVIVPSRILQLILKQIQINLIIKYNTINEICNDFLSFEFQLMFKNIQSNNDLIRITHMYVHLYDTNQTEPATFDALYLMASLVNEALTTTPGLRFLFFFIHIWI